MVFLIIVAIMYAANNDFGRKIFGVQLIIITNFQLFLK